MNNTQQQTYDHCIEQWDKIFRKGNLSIPKKKTTGNSVFDSGIAWIAHHSNTVLDFGCGPGSVLFLCSMYGTKEHIGIDLSSQAIENAKIRSTKMPQGSFEFIHGGIERLSLINDESIDAIILSNIIDNLYPDDCKKVLSECKRILKLNGKILIKVNPYLTDEDIKKEQIKVMDHNMLDDGLLLLNNTTEQWRDLIQSYFTIHKYEDIYYEEYKQHNRMFLARNVQ